MAWTQADLDEIEKAIATGARVIRTNDRTVEFRTLSEMIELRDRIREKVAGPAPGRRSRTSFAATSKGL